MLKESDYVGKKFGRLTVIGWGETLISPSGSKCRRFLCQCDCGGTINAKPNRLRNGKTISCGCTYKEKGIRGFHRRHSLAYEEDGKMVRMYAAWHAMKQRCNNKNSDEYNNYGGRGIAVCDEWQNDYKAFRDWSMANGYSDDLTIDRRDNDKGYSPENCRWVSNKVQITNRRISPAHIFPLTKNDDNFIFEAKLIIDDEENAELFRASVERLVRDYRFVNRVTPISCSE